MLATEGSNKLQAMDPLYEMEFFYVALFETRNTHAMVMTQVVLVLSPLPTIRCSKRDGVMRLNILFCSEPSTCQITQCRIQTLREGRGAVFQKIFSGLV